MIGCVAYLGHYCYVQLLRSRDRSFLFLFFSVFDAIDRGTEDDRLQRRMTDSRVSDFWNQRCDTDIESVTLCSEHLGSS